MSVQTDTLFKPGTVIENKWIIIELIGKGAMGEVYQAHQLNLKRDVAIKTISDQMLNELEDDPQEMETTFKRFHREVQSMAQVRHPNILSIFDYGAMPGKKRQTAVEQSIEYIVMEYIPGNTLRFTMSDEGLDDEPDLYADWISRYFLPVLDGVEAMHQHGVFHRDLKPENIFMDGEIPKIADFGLARSYKLKAVSNSMEMKGTLSYMAPEQFSDFRKADQTADIYALGKILFEAVNGKLTQKTLPLKQVRLKEMENLDTPLLKHMDVIIQKATSEDKTIRFQSIAELRLAVENVLKLDKKKPSPNSFKTAEFVSKNTTWIWMGIGIAMVSVLAMTLWHIMGGSGQDSLTQIKKEKKIISDSAFSTPEEANRLQQAIIGRDGSQMVLTGSINSEKDILSSQAGKNFLFYIDKRKVSRFLYVDFLNQVRQELTIENKVVKHDGKIVLYLGKASQPEAPIIYQHERFHLNNQDQGSQPVTRVTYHGAMLYAGYFGRSLLTDDEWRFAYQFHKERQPDLPAAKPEENQEPFSHMMQAPSQPSSPAPSIKVLDRMGQSIQEWVKVPMGKSAPGSASMPDQGLSAGLMTAARPDPDLMQKWEGFPDAGFRTKIRIRQTGEE